MTERERRALLRRRPNVTSWRHLLETAKGEYEHANDLLPTPAEVSATPENPFGASLPFAS